MEKNNPEADLRISKEMVKALKDGDLKRWHQERVECLEEQLKEKNKLQR